MNFFTVEDFDRILPAKIPDSVLYSKELNPYEKIVFAVLYNSSGVLSTHEIADKASISRKTVINAIKKLEELEILKVVRTSGEINTYKF